MKRTNTERKNGKLVSRHVLSVLLLTITTAPTAYASGIVTILHHFTGKADGSNPVGGVVRDAAGTLYGETFRGSGVKCTTGYEAGAQCGTVYSLDTAGNFKVLATFTGPNGAHGIVTPLLIGTTLYGATYDGGAGDAGVVFSVNTDGTAFTLLHQFTGADGSEPTALVAGHNGMAIYPDAVIAERLDDPDLDHAIQTTPPAECAIRLCQHFGLARNTANWPADFHQMLQTLTRSGQQAGLPA